MGIVPGRNNIGVSAITLDAELVYSAHIDLIASGMINPEIYVTDVIPLTEPH